MRKQVLPPEQMQALIDLGVDVSGASMFYKRGVWSGQDYDYKLLPTGVKEPFLIGRNDIPTFDLSDILEVIFNMYNDYYVEIDRKHIRLQSKDGHKKLAFTGLNLLEASYNCLVYLLKEQPH